MKTFNILLICAIVTLSGCGKSPIDAVKSSYIDSARTTTVANALSNRSLCNSTKWEKFKDDKGRMLVQYNCEIIDGKDFLRVQREHATEKKNEYYRRDLESAKKYSDEANSKLESDFQDIKERMARLQNLIDGYQSLPNLNISQGSQLNNARREIQDLDAQLISRRRDTNNDLNRGKEWLQKSQQQLASNEAQEIAAKSYPVYTSAEELFQWMVNNEGSVILTHGEIQATNATGQKITFLKYNKPDLILEYASESKQSELLEYTHAMGMYTFTRMLTR